MDLRQRALAVLQTADLASKVAQALVISGDSATLSIAKGPLQEPPGVPGRPALPRLVEPTAVAHRAPASPAGLAALLHAIAHIEFNAINLALDAIWRFDGLPDAYYRDWARVASEEALHFSLLRAHLQSLPHTGTPWDYGSFDAHDGLWAMCERTSDDVVARMALVPRTLEARGLDASPRLQARLQGVGSPDARRTVEILDVILRDEIGHVAIGNHWYRWLCERDGLEPVAHYRALRRRYRAPLLKPPFNLPARRAAGFTDTELAELEA